MSFTSQCIVLVEVVHKNCVLIQITLRNASRSSNTSDILDPIHPSEVHCLSVVISDKFVVYIAFIRGVYITSPSIMSVVGNVWRVRLRVIFLHLVT